MRFLRFRAWLDEMHRLTGGFDRLVYEQVRRHAGVDASHIYGVAVGTVKRHATGKGNAGKHAVIDAMRVRGFNPSDDNEADALAILVWALDTRGGVR